MKFAPHYDGPPLLDTDDSPGSILVPLARQRRRLESTLAGLSDEQWGHPSRCAGWTVRDVAVHLMTVTPFWTLSISAGLAGEPTRFLDGFDPVATPAAMVDARDALTPADIVARLTAANDELLGLLGGLDHAQWSIPAEAPPGHLPVHLLSHHDLWDSWTHERDIVVPLGLDPVVEPDEVAASLRYAAAVHPLTGRAVGRTGQWLVAVEATGPDVAFVVDVGDTISLRTVTDPGGLPCLRGDAVALVEALSLRAPMPAGTPPEWVSFVTGLQAAFDQLPDGG